MFVAVARLMCTYYVNVSPVRFTVEDLLFNRSGRGTPEITEIPQQILGRLGLPRSRFTGYDNTLGLFQHLHVSEGLIACGKTEVYRCVVAVRSN